MSRAGRPVTGTYLWGVADLLHIRAVYVLGAVLLFTAAAVGYTTRTDDTGGPDRPPS